MNFSFHLPAAAWFLVIAIVFLLLFVPFAIALWPNVHNAPKSHPLLPMHPPLIFDHGPPILAQMFIRDHLGIVVNSMDEAGLALTVFALQFRLPPRPFWLDYASRFGNSDFALHLEKILEIIFGLDFFRKFCFEKYFWKYF